MAIIDTVNV